MHHLHTTLYSEYCMCVTITLSFLQQQQGSKKESLQSIMLRGIQGSTARWMDGLLGMMVLFTTRLPANPPTDNVT